jgi:hypothetical protein
MVLLLGFIRKICYFPEGNICMGPWGAVFIALALPKENMLFSKESSVGFYKDNISSDAKLVVRPPYIVHQASGSTRNLVL